MKRNMIILIAIAIGLTGFLIYRYFLFGYGSSAVGKYSTDNPLGVTDPFGFTGPGATYSGYDYLSNTYY